MMNDMPGGAGGPGGYNDPMGGDKPITVTSVLKEFQGLKDKFKNEDEDDCELVVAVSEKCCCFLLASAAVR